MPTFPAPHPLTVVLDQLVGSVQVIASPRDDAVVTVLPSNPGRAADVRLAQETTVGLVGDVLTVTGPASLRTILIGPKGAVDVTVEVPTGSGVSGKLMAGPLDTKGPLGAVSITLSAGNASIQEADRLDVRASAGSVVVGRAAGATNIRSSAGSVRIHEVHGDAAVKSSSGSTMVGSVTGSLTVSGAHGEVVVGRVRGSVEAEASSGSIRIDALESGVATARTAHGSIEVGVPEGIAAWVDASTSFGHVRNRLTPTEAPAGGDDAPFVEIHATTSYGDVLVRRPESASPIPEI